MAQVSIQGEDGEVLTFQCVACDELVYSGVTLRGDVPLTGDADMKLPLRCPACHHQDSYPLRALRNAGP